VVPPKRPTRFEDTRRRLLPAAVGGGLGLLLLGWWAWPSGGESAPLRSAVAEAEEVEDPAAGVAASHVKSEAKDPPEQHAELSDQLAEIDRLLFAGRLAAVDRMLQPLLDQHPNHPLLLWRQGRMFAKGRRGKQKALAAYGRALDSDPELIEDHDFYAEIYDLLEYGPLRDDALDIALRSMGSGGHKFLIGLVNDTRRPLGYSDRQRALEELARDPENETLINRRLNNALDLLQADQALAPCTAYADALDAMTAAPEAFYRPRVERTPPPEVEDVPEEDRQQCQDLAPRREQLIALLASMQAVEDAQQVALSEGELAAADADPSEAKPPAEQPAGGTAKKTSSKAKGSRKSSRSNCKKVGSIFDKNCWKQR
jgi:hypothetical protein